MSTSTEIHQQTPSSDDHTITIKTTYEYAETDERIRKAAVFNKWDDVRELFEATPELMTKPVNERLETPLMIAVGRNHSHEFVKQLLNNVETHDRDKWCGVNITGNNALHYAAKFGSIEDAKLMLQCLPFTMRWNKNIDGDTPLLLATKLGRKDMIDQVFNKYDINQLSVDSNIIASAIQAGFLDLATRSFRNVLFSKREITSKHIVLEALATKPDLFYSGNKLGFWGSLIYQYLASYILKSRPSEELTADDANGLEALATKPENFRSGNGLGFWCSLICPWMRTVKSKIPTSLRRICQLTTIISVLLLPFVYVKTWLQQIQEYIRKKTLISYNIVIRLCNKIEKNPKDAKKFFELAITKAVKYGTVELIEECILAYPGLIWYEFDGYNLFHLAIKERQVKVYNLVYQMSGHKAFVASDLHGEENALHIAAELAPSYRLSTITGAALQLQLELQWYQEVEAFVEPGHVKAKNKDGKTPWMVFVDAHKDLLKEGQQWMKDTATSCTIVAALIVTITFAAAITVPGGNKDDGKPVFINKGAFLLFMISDALALFSSSTSLLMFLGILTSRYAEMDFLHALPKRLAIGLASLFLSIAATMIAFGTTLVLLLHDEVTWISAPVVMMTSIPVVLYALLQFPLLVEIVWSTYGPSIFRKQGSRMIY